MAEVSKKWYAVGAFIILFIIALGLAFSNFGCGMIQDQIDSAYNECPQAERKTQEAANYQLKLASWYEVSLREEEARKCYMDFLEKKTDWGWEHTRAPEVYLRYLAVFERTHSWESNRFEGEIFFQKFLYHPRYADFYPDAKMFMERNKGAAPPGFEPPQKRR